jgi:hypothetical protein
LELFKTLSREEIYLLKNYLDSKGEGYISNSEWEIKFRDYISKLV